MATTVAITDHLNRMLEKRLLEISDTHSRRIPKEGFLHALLLLALSDADLVQQAAYLSLYYFGGRGVVRLEYKRL